MAKFTSDVKGKWVNTMDVTAAQAEAIMADDSRTFYCAPSIAPVGFGDFSAGMNVFPMIGADGNIMETTIIYEVLGRVTPDMEAKLKASTPLYEFNGRVVFDEMDSAGNRTGLTVSYPEAAFDPATGRFDSDRKIVWSDAGLNGRV